MIVPSRLRRYFTGSALVSALVSTGSLAASGAAPTGLELTKNCSIVGVTDLSRILGVDVQASDRATQTGGICTFPSQSATEEGVASYAIVTQPDVVARATYFRIVAIRRCGNVDPSAPNAAQCATFRKLASATTVAEYYTDRTATPDAAPQTGLGDRAIATATALYVLRGGEVFECVARRSEFLDVERSNALATLLLERVAPIDAPPTPAASNGP